MGNGKEYGFYAKNFWGKKWTLISLLVIILTGIAIYFFDKGKKINQEQNINMDSLNTKH